MIAITPQKIADILAKTAPPGMIRKTCSLTEGGRLTKCFLRL
jgi:hypothetical protein